MGVPDATLKGGANARQAAIAGGWLSFRTFLHKTYGQPAFTEIAARDAILAVCGFGFGTNRPQPLTSRKQLDNDAAAIAAWEALWSNYLLWKDPRR